MKKAQANASAGMNVPPEQMDALLNLAGKQLGKDPSQLRQQLQSGQITQALSGLDKQKAAQVASILNDPKRLEELMNSPQVKSMLSGLMKKNT